MIRLLRYIQNRIAIYRQRRHQIKHLGAECIIDPSVIFLNHDRIHIGNYCRIGPHCHLDGEGGLTIDDGSILAPNVTILSSTHRYNQTNYLPYDEYDEYRPVVIGKGCWIGWGAMIAPGVVIGDGAVVAMGAVVVSDVEEGTVVGGNPATKIKSRDNIVFIKESVQKDNYYLKAKTAENLKRRPIDEI